MPSRTRQRLFISIAVIGLFFTLIVASYGESITYVYDELNRLKRVEYGDGNKIEYTYDNAGNRSQIYVGKYTLTVTVVGSGTVTKNPDQPIYGEGTTITLTAVNGGQTFSAWRRLLYVIMILEARSITGAEVHGRRQPLVSVLPET